MLVKFLQDFRGRETKEIFYKQGEEAELPDHAAQQLLADRRVELVDFPKPETAEEFVKPAVFENVTDVDTEVIELTHDEVSAPAAEPPKPKSKRKK